MLTRRKDGKLEDSEGEIYKEISDSDTAEYSSGHNSWSVEENVQKCPEVENICSNIDLKCYDQEESNWESEDCDLERKIDIHKKRFALNEMFKQNASKFAIFYV